MSDTNNSTAVDTNFKGAGNSVQATSEGHPTALSQFLQDYDNLSSDASKASVLTAALIISFMGRNGDRGMFFLMDPKFQEPKVCALVCKSLRTHIAQMQAQITEQPNLATASVREADAWRSQIKKASILTHILQMVERGTTPIIAPNVAVVRGHTPRNTPEPT